MFQRGNKLGIRNGRVQKPGPIRPLFFPTETCPDSVEHREFPISSRNYEFFHGYDSIFTLQHWTDIVIDEKVYKSVDQYYQMMKAYDLTETTSEKFDDSRTKNYSAVAREILREKNISRKSVDEWRTKCGIEVIQRAILAKVKQSSAFRDRLIATGDKIIAHSFPTDDFFGTGCPVKYITDWSTSMEKEGKTLKYPMAFPLTEKTARYVPTLAKGRNMLGAIYMALREQIMNGRLDALVVELTPVNKLVIITQNRNPPSARPMGNPREIPSRIPRNDNPNLVQPLREMSLGLGSSMPQAPFQASDPYQAYLQQQYPQSRSQIQQVNPPSHSQDYVATNQQYNAAPYAGYSGGNAPVMYSEEQRVNRMSNIPSIVSQMPEMPTGNRYYPGTTAARNLEDIYNAQRQQYQQRAEAPKPSYTSLAIQNHDFSLDVDERSGAISNVRAMPQAPRPPNMTQKPTFQGQYEWNWD